MWSEPVTLVEFDNIPITADEGRECTIEGTALRRLTADQRSLPFA